jgi:GAF domain-containing protein
MPSEVSLAGAQQDCEPTVGELKRELAEAREQQRATSNILAAISSSPTDLKRVFADIAMSAAGLCDAHDAAIHQVDGDFLPLVAHYGPILVPDTLPLTRGVLAGRAVLDRQTIQVVDLQAETHEYPEGSKIARRLGLRTNLAVPLIRLGEAIGVIVIRRTEVRPFTERQIELAKTFANQAVIAIENTRLFEEVEARTRELTESLEYQIATGEVLNVISRSSFELERVFSTIVETAGRLCHADFAIVLRLGDDGKYHLAASYGYSPEFLAYVERNPLTVGRATVVGRVALEGRAVHVTDVLADRDYGYQEGQRLGGYRAALGVPLLREGKPIGALALSRSQPKPYTQKQIELVETFADQAVIAIENTRLFEEVQARTKELEARTKELQESLEYQTATGEVLNVISRSPNELQPVLNAIVATAGRLCEADYAHCRLERNGRYHVMARHALNPDEVESVPGMPVAADRTSVSGKSISECRTIHVPDVLADPEDTYAVNVGVPARTILGVPLVRNGKAIGVIVLFRRTVRPFTQRQIDLVTTFADQAVIAIENTRLFEGEQASKRELTQALEQQTATADVLKVISRSALDLQRVLDALVESAARLCEANDALIFQVFGDGLRLVAHHGQIPTPRPVGQFTIPLERGSIAGCAVIDRRTIQVADMQAEADEYPETRMRAVQGGYRTSLVVPLVHAGEAIGVIFIRRTEVRPFTESQIELVNTFADQAVIAIENTRLFNELRESLQQQTATADVLKIISRSTFDLQAVLNTLVEAAAQLCEADMAQISHPTRDAGHYIAASYGFSPEYIEYHKNVTFAPGQGSLTGRVLLEGKPVQITDVLADPEYRNPEPQRLGGYRTHLGVPLLRDGSPIGVILVSRREVRPFDNKQIKLVTTFADQAVIAIENTRLFEEVQSRTKELQQALEYQTATSDVLNVISRSPNQLQPVFDAIVQSAVKLCDGLYGALNMFDGEKLLRPTAFHNYTPAALAAVERMFPTLPSRRQLTGRAILDRAVAQIPDVLNDPEYAPDVALAGGWRAGLAVPMFREGHPIGTILVTRAQVGPFSERQIDLLQTFADQAVIAIENARLFEEVQARNRDLTALGEVGRVVSSTLDLKIVLKAIVDRAVELSGTDGGLIFYYREKLGKFELGETSGLDQEIVERYRKLDIASGQTGLGEAIANRQPLQVPDVMQRASNVLRDAALEAGLRAALIVPLLSADGPLGALLLQRRQPGEFPNAVVALMQSFADQSAIALENARLFEEIARKGRELEIASQHKSQFVANMSHELRTPLAAILGYAELMQEGFYEPLGQKSLDALARIRSNGKHLLGLINTVLDIAKIESGQFTLNMAEYAIESVVETVRAATESLAETKKLALKTEVTRPLPIGLGDEQRLTQVLLNLVGNAIKFTDTGEVRVTAKAVNGHFNVSVADTGPGIPERERTRIFDQFHQVDSSLTKAKGGTGLGLAISKQIVEMHGGRIWVESTLGKGSTFQMEIPTRAEFQKRAL